jgi:serine/threonine protein kinase
MAIEAKVIEARFATTRIAEAIADERPVDWSPAERALGSDARELDNLRLLDDVARAFRSVGEQPRRVEAPAPLFHWGPLEVSAQLGEGQTGEVFRAFDPTLQRDVALKLRAQRDPLSDPANAQLLAEARQLARIRHRNVLAIYGAAVHEGRAGIWSELIDGRTLKQIVAADGPFGVDEALRIGLDVCRALGVVHAAGLVHGDVKAENVMRERGGRIVLMDFGASGRRDELAARSTVSGTRCYLAPEILAGATPDVRSDLYALGVLLHYLLSGAFPRDEHGARSALAQCRPDLPAALCVRLDALVAEDPTLRPRDAATFAQVLVGLLPERAAPTPPRTRWFAAAAGIALAAIALTAMLLPAPAWQVHADFIDPATARPIADGTPVRIGDALALSVEATRPSHVYVLNEDADGELNVLFPLAGLDLQNPLPPDRAIQLPGRADGRALSWQISSPTASEEFVMIAAPNALPGLERRLAAAQQAEIETDTATRGAAQLRTAPASTYGLEGAHLVELVELARREAGDPDALQVKTLRLPHAQ